MKFREVLLILLLMLSVFASLALSLPSNSQSIPTRRGASIAPAAVPTNQATTNKGGEPSNTRKHTQASGADSGLRVTGKSKSRPATTESGAESSSSPPKPHKKSLFDSLLHPTQRKQLGAVPEHSSPGELEQPPPLPVSDPPKDERKGAALLVQSMEKQESDKEPGLVPKGHHNQSEAQRKEQQRIPSPPPLSTKLQRSGAVEESPTSAFQSSSPAVKAATSLPIRPQPVLAHTSLGKRYKWNAQTCICTHICRMYTQTHRVLVPLPVKVMWL